MVQMQAGKTGASPVLNVQVHYNGEAQEVIAETAFAAATMVIEIAKRNQLNAPKVAMAVGKIILQIVFGKENTGITAEELFKQAMERAGK
jgi:tRNA C32,U32 (ribose-2'-O)-methylase TrmJ